MDPESAGSTAPQGVVFQRRVALVVGINRYDNVNMLRNAVADAEAIAGKLEELGFAVSLHRNPNREELGSQLAAFTGSLRDGDLAVVYYSGHGVGVGQTNYLLPSSFRTSYGASDSLVEHLTREAVLLEDFIAGVNRRATASVFLFDACRNNPWADRALRNPRAANGVGRGLAPVDMTRRAGSFVAFAAQPGSTADDGTGDHSPFAAALLAHLAEPVSVGEILDEVAGEVSRATGEQQDPTRESRLRGRVVLTGRVPTEVPRTGPAPSTAVLTHSAVAPLTLLNQPAGAVAPSCPPGMALLQPPAGGFLLGTDIGAANAGEYDGHPRVRVRLSPYCLDTHEVTVARFRGFWSAGHPAPTAGIRYPNGAVIAWSGAVSEPVARSADSICNWTATAGDREDHPINCVDWWTAQGFCAAGGGRLPTEAEWEFAARGSDERSFPWGQEAPGTQRVCWNRRISGTCLSGLFPPTLNGVYDLAGNVWEWVADGWLDRQSAYQAFVVPAGAAPTLDPVIYSDDFQARVLRGGGWYNSAAAGLRAAARFGRAPSSGNFVVGLRCARPPTNSVNP
ncbi:MAG: SUMF1/EgtB/PvdO family nonheme iron enzyme [Deltaproteobacteria bacterium]|nr:SUMF1/EgtB/PvdO family nonheme iron enzyme [Deltaproteobacteria bacterium]